jgi:hypothetical protein
MADWEFMARRTTLFEAGRSANSMPSPSNGIKTSLPCSSF